MLAFKGWRASLLQSSSVPMCFGVPLFFVAFQFLCAMSVEASVSKRLTTRQSLLIARYIEEAAAKHHLEPALLRAIITVESAYNYKAISHAGAHGLMQIMPKTAKALGHEEALDSSTPHHNIFAGAKLIRQLINRYQGKIKLALAAYNAGPTAVARYNGIPPYKETQNYVRKVLARLDHERAAQLNLGH